MDIISPTEIDQWLDSRLILDSERLDGAVKDAADSGLPPIQVTALFGKFLMMLAKTIQAKKVLEIGTLGGFSTVWLARALPASGKVISLELEPHHAEVARRTVASAGVGEKVDVRVGSALDLLPSLMSEAPFDLTFIDADKRSIPQYFDWAIKLSRPGALIVVDNVVRDGKILETNSDDPDTLGVQQFLTEVASDLRVMGSAIQTIGAKEHDGFAVFVVN
jgi:predicted O-methyltransferase YrrM